MFKKYSPFVYSEYTMEKMTNHGSYIAHYTINVQEIWKNYFSLLPFSNGLDVHKCIEEIKYT